jgi:hypothetical protein
MAYSTVTIEVWKYTAKCDNKECSSMTQAFYLTHYTYLVPQSIIDDASDSAGCGFDPACHFFVGFGDLVLNENPKGALRLAGSIAAGAGTFLIGRTAWVTLSPLIRKTCDLTVLCLVSGMRMAIYLAFAGANSQFSD